MGSWFWGSQILKDDTVSLHFRLPKNSKFFSFAVNKHESKDYYEVELFYIDNKKLKATHPIGVMDETNLLKTISFLAS